MITKSNKDTLIIVSVLVVIAVGYFVFMKPQQPAQPPQQEMSEFDHPDVAGMDGSAMASSVSFPTDYDALIQVGHQTMDQGNFPVAAECYKRALAIKGDDPNIRTDYGACLHGMGLPHRALEEFGTVLATYPDHKIANFNMGIVHYNEQRFDSARMYWEKYLTLEPEGNVSNTVRQYLQQIGG